MYFLLPGGQASRESEVYREPIYTFFPDITLCKQLILLNYELKLKKLEYKLLHNTDVGHRESVHQKHLPETQSD